jgi:hypothetical protein
MKPFNIRVRVEWCLFVRDVRLRRLSAAPNLARGPRRRALTSLRLTFLTCTPLKHREPVRILVFISKKAPEQGATGYLHLASEITQLGVL